MSSGSHNAFSGFLFSFLFWGLEIAGSMCYHCIVSFIWFLFRSWSSTTTRSLTSAQYSSLFLVPSPPSADGVHTLSRRCPFAQGDRYSWPRQVAGTVQQYMQVRVGGYSLISYTFHLDTLHRDLCHHRGNCGFRIENRMGLSAIFCLVRPLLNGRMNSQCALCFGASTDGMLDNM